MKTFIVSQNGKNFIGLVPETVNDAETMQNIALAKGIDIDAGKQSLFICIDNLIANCAVHTMEKGIGDIDLSQASEYAPASAQANAVRCRMKCDHFDKAAPAGSAVTLPPVIGGSPENDKFFVATPAGVLELSIVNPDVSFVVGAEYYVDIVRIVDSETSADS